MLMLERTELIDRLITDFARDVGATVGRPRRGRSPRRVDELAVPIEGVRVGHWTGGRTGVTVLLVPGGHGRLGRGARRRAGDAGARVARPDAHRRRGSTRWCSRVVRAFGLAAADGVMRFLAERGQGYATAAARCRSCRRRAIFDLVESGGAFPGADDGYAAAVGGRAGRDARAGPGRRRPRRDRREVAGRRARRSLAGSGWRRRVVDGAAWSSRSPSSTRSATSSAADGRCSPVVGAGPGRRSLPGGTARRPGAGEHHARRPSSPTPPSTRPAASSWRRARTTASHRAIRPAHTRFDGDLAIVARDRSPVDAPIDRRPHRRGRARPRPRSATPSPPSTRHCRRVPATRTPTGPEEALGPTASIDGGTGRIVTAEPLSAHPATAAGATLTAVAEAASRLHAVPARRRRARRSCSARVAADARPDVRR